MDPVLLAAKLRDRGILDAVGGQDYLVELATQVPDAANALHYARLVQETAGRGRLLKLAETLFVHAHEDRADCSQNIADAQQELNEIQDLATPGRKLTTLCDALLIDVADETEDLIPTGIDGVDAAMPGGALRRGDKVVIGGPPGIGKTAFALQLSISAAATNRDLQIVWCAGEMHEHQLRNRALCCQSGLTLDVLKRPWDELTPLPKAQKQQAIDDLRDIGSRIHFVKAPLTPTVIESAIRETGARWIVVDYLQLCRTETATSSRRDEIDLVVHELTRMAQMYRAVVFIISNMAKGSERGRTVFDAFKESSEIAFAADLCYVGELFGKQNDPDDDLPDEVGVKWRCLKARNGMPRSITTRFERFRQRFEVLK